MPADYRIARALGLVISRGWGVVTDDDLLGHARALGRDPHFRPDLRQLYDFRDAAAQDFGGATVLELANLSPFGAGARRAIVVGGDIAFGMAQMFKLLRDNLRDDIRVFRDVGEALAWLDLAEHAAEVLATLATIREAHD